MQPDPSLLEIQQHFLDALYENSSPNFCNEAILNSAIEPAARLRIYRNSSTQIHMGTLQTAYPAVRALVGAEFFEHAANLYRTAHPSTSGNLQTFGANFPDFLESLTHNASVPYLGDIARLEWLRQCTILAGIAPALDPVDATQQIAQLSGPLFIGLHPSVHCFASGYPVYTLWHYAMQPGDQRLSAPETGEHVVLWRETGKVVMAVLDKASFHCVHALTLGSTLDQAYSLAQKYDLDFDLTACFANLVTQGLVTDIAAASTKEVSL
ncbi:MAG: DNA-binding domain-containing protein [Paralcaligenes sp.]